MKTIELKELTGKTIKSNEELQVGNFRVGHDGQYYYVGNLFHSTIYSYFDTVKELREYLNWNK